MRTGRDSTERTRSGAPDGAALIVRGRRVPMSGVVAGAGALTAATLAFGLAAAQPPDRLTAVLVHTIMVAVPAAVAVGVLHRRPRDRFAALLLVAAALLALTALSLSDDSLVHSVGRVSVWVVEPMIVFLLLAFPFGRLPGRAERAVFGSAVAVAGVLFVGSALLTEGFPEPVPWDTCGAACPGNAFMLSGSEPGFVADIVRPVREVLTVLVFFAVAGLLARRMHRAATLGRRILAPVLVTALIRAVTIAVYERARAGGEVTTGIETLGWLFALTPALLALGFAAGLLSARLYVATVLERLTRRLRADVTPSELTAEMADALEDPSLRIVYDANDIPGQWCDEEGRPAEAPVTRAGRAISTVRVSGRAAAIDHDELLRLEPGVVEAAATYAITVLEHDWLVRELQSSLRELSASRARIVTVGAQARRRIERDLHDGAQQRLVAVRAHLGLQSERLRENAPHAADALDGLALIVDETIDEVRSIARGIYPSLLADRGLVEALHAAALGAPLGARVDAEGVGRYDPEIETTVYYACIEALQNAVKHAAGATGVWISLSDTGNLRFEVQDDGAGFAVASHSPGTGLMNLRDRLAAVGGVVTIESEIGVGTRVAGMVPVRRNGRPTPEAETEPASEPALGAPDAV
jgi:signal transduction histidine kinase